MTPLKYSLSEPLRYSFNVAFMLSIPYSTGCKNIYLVLLILLPAYALVAWLRTYQAKRALWQCRYAANKQARINHLMRAKLL